MTSDHKAVEQHGGYGEEGDKHYRPLSNDEDFREKSGEERGKRSREGGARRLERGKSRKEGG